MTAVVVLQTPPFWFATAMMRFIGSNPSNSTSSARIEAGTRIACRPAPSSRRAGPESPSGRVPSSRAAALPARQVSGHPNESARARARGRSRVEWHPRLQRLRAGPGRFRRSGAERRDHGRRNRLLALDSTACSGGPDSQSRRQARKTRARADSAIRSPRRCGSTASNRAGAVDDLVRSVIAVRLKRVFIPRVRHRARRACTCAGSRRDARASPRPSSAGLQCAAALTSADLHDRAPSTPPFR